MRRKSIGRLVFGRCCLVAWLVCVAVGIVFDCRGRRDVGIGWFVWSLAWAAGAAWGAR